jgi:hypothetical protein
LTVVQTRWSREPFLAEDAAVDETAFSFSAASLATAVGFSVVDVKADASLAFFDASLVEADADGGVADEGRSGCLGG